MARLKDIDSESPNASSSQLAALIDYRADDTNVYRKSINSRNRESANNTTTSQRTDNDGGHTANTTTTTTNQQSSSGTTDTGGAGAGGGTGPTDTGGAGAGGGTTTPPEDVPTVAIFERNTSKGLYVEYKGIKYPIDKKNTTDDGNGTAWEDDTFTVGTTVINFKNFYQMDAANRTKIMKTALGIPVDNPGEGQGGRTGQFGGGKTEDEKPPENTDRYPIIDGKVVKTVVGPDGKEYPIDPKTGSVSIPSKNADGSVVTKTYDAKTYLENKKQEDAMANAGNPPTNPSGSNAAQNASSNGQTSNTGGSPATNKPGSDIEKQEAKQKANASPQGAPAKVDESEAMTITKVTQINERTDAVPASIMIQQGGYIKSRGYYGAPGTWGWRLSDDKYNGTGKPENELAPITGVNGSVDYFFDADWNKLTKNTGRGVSVNNSKLNVVDYPIIMNFPEVGIWNKTVPYIAQEQTEQHRMIAIDPGSTGHNMKKYGIGTYSGYETPQGDKAHGPNPNWADEPWWCGISSRAVLDYGGYKSIYPCGSGAGNTPAAGWKDRHKIISEKENTLASYAAIMENGVEKPFDKFMANQYGKDDWSGREPCPLLKHYQYGGKMEKRTVEYEVTKSVDVPHPTDPKKKIKQLQKVTDTKIVEEFVPGMVYESLLPNPTMIIFLKDYHYTSKGMTKQGIRLAEHALNQKGFEIAVMSKGHHVEVAVFLNTNGTGITFGGNTSSTVASKNGMSFVAKKFTFWDWTGKSNFISFTKCVSKHGPQKVESTLNGKFRRTPIVDSYYSLVGKENVLGTLKSIYDSIVEKG